MQRNEVAFVRQLKGAPASIVLALAMAGTSFSMRELEVVTGYSDKPLSRGLALLELLGLAVNNGRANGWSIANNFQLSLYSAALPGRMPAALPGGYMWRGSRNVSDQGSSYSSSSSDPDEMDGEEEVVKGAEAGDSPDSEVRYWLEKAGVGRRSPKMRGLLARNLDPEYVRAWVLELAWWQVERSRGVEAPGGRSRFSVGTLIRILEDGDEAPAERCEDCLGRLSVCMCGVVVR